MTLGFIFMSHKTRRVSQSRHQSFKELGKGDHDAYRAVCARHDTSGLQKGAAVPRGEEEREGKYALDIQNS